MKTVTQVRWWMIVESRGTQVCGSLHPDYLCGYLRREGHEVVLCDGRTYDPTVWRELAAVIGDSYGVDEESGLPRVPDLISRVMA